MNILIHADPGARSQFVYACITDQLHRPSFDVGLDTKIRFNKIHQLQDPDILRCFDGIKIRIKPIMSSIDRHSLLFLRKNIPRLFPNFTSDEYCLETYTKLAEFAKEIFTWDRELDYDLYDYVLTFDETLDDGFMEDFYLRINGRAPSPDLLLALCSTNALNRITVDKNHACSILKLIMSKETSLRLEEKNRFWSVVDVYNHTPVTALYDTIDALINPDNYGTLLPWQN